MAKKVPFPPDFPKQCLCAQNHISWSVGDDYVFCWDCNRRYLLLACFRQLQQELSNTEKSSDKSRPHWNPTSKSSPCHMPKVQTHLNGQAIWKSLSCLWGTTTEALKPTISCAWTNPRKVWIKGCNINFPNDRTELPVPPFHCISELIFPNLFEGNWNLPERERGHCGLYIAPSDSVFRWLPPEGFSNKWIDFHRRSGLLSRQSIKGRLYWRPGFVLEEDPFVKSGNLKFGTMRTF